jgi:TP901 family phage tail tape measure protein
MLGGLGLSPALIGGIGAGMGFKEVIQQASDFETALVNIQKKAGTTAEQTRELGEQIKELATDGSVAVSIDEIAKGMERGAAAGLPLDQLRQFAMLSAKAADAFEMSSQDIGNAAAGFNTVLKIPMNEMQKYFDLINGLADSGIADESAIVAYVDQGGAMAKTFGLMPDQIAAVGASLANLKVPAAKAATATNAIFAKLLAPESMSGPAIHAFNRLIKDTTKFQKQLASGQSEEAFIGMLDALNALDKETRTGIIADLFGQDHLDVMMQMVEGADELKRNLKYAGGDTWFGSLDKSYALKLNTMASQWQIFKNQASELAINVGTAGMPALREGLEGAKYLVDEIGKGFKAFKGQIDMTAFENAKDVIAALGLSMSQLIATDPSESEILRFFREMAMTVNQINAGIVTLDNWFGIAKESAPGKMLGGDKEGAAKLLGTTVNPDTGRLNPIPLQRGGLIPGLTEWLGKNSGAGLIDKPGAQQQKWGRVSGVSQGQFDTRWDTEAPVKASMQPGQAALESSLAAGQQTLAIIEQVKAATAIPPSLLLDNTQYMTNANAAIAAKGELGENVVATADINIAPAMAKINTLREAIQGVNNMAVTAGGTNAYGSNVRNQFAPVGPG